MRYDKQNRKLSSLEGEISKLRSDNTRLKDEAESMKDILNSTLHEVRRFSAQVSRFSERLSRETENQTQINQTALSVFYTANMISSRLAYTDMELNPKALENQVPVRSGIYKKFDKAKRILAEEARDKGVMVNLVGESRDEIDALPVFELLPFVLIENGIKYSPPDQSVEISFEKPSGKQIVTINSVGPYVFDDEIGRLFEKNFRGRNTRRMPGEGRGLFLAKNVCDYHGIGIDIASNDTILYQMNGISYSNFSVRMRF